MKHTIVTGTDTYVGKTLCSAMLVDGLDGAYWKPVQSGTRDRTDRETIQSIAELDDDRFFKEAYCLTEPLSPHRAAELDQVVIDPSILTLPSSTRPLIIEGAGGLLVPVTRDLLQIDLFAVWKIPVVLCARTTLGTINHTLLSVEALKRRNIAIRGLVFIGADNADTVRTIVDFAGLKVLGRIPPLDRVDKKSLAEVFQKNFKKQDFL